MAPSATSSPLDLAVSAAPKSQKNIIGGHPDALSTHLEPLQYSGSLDKFTRSDSTPVIGTEFEGLQVTELLESDDQVIRDLAWTSTYNNDILLEHEQLRI